MKLSKLEKGVLILTAVFLVLTIGAYLVDSSGEAPYTVSAQTLWTREVGEWVADTAGTQLQTPEPEPAETATQPVEELEAAGEGDAAEESAAPAPSQEPAEPAGKVNINTATSEQLQTLPGIGPARAEAILKDRESNGPFRIPEDITRVSGIGEGILSNILDYITVG